MNVHTGATCQRPRVSLLPRRSPALAAAAGALVLMAACSSGKAADSGAAAPAASTNASNSVSAIAYEGPEAGLPSTYPEPKVVQGTAFKVGYLNPFAAIPGLKATQDAAQKQTEALGGTFIAKDAGVDPQKQVTQFNDLLAQGVNVIVGYPLNAQSWTASIAKANATGVPVIVESTPWDLSMEPLPGVTANVNQAFDHQAYAEAKAVAEKHPGAPFAIITTALPIPSLQYLGSRQEYWGKKFGLDYLGRQDAQGDTPSAAATAAGSLLTKYPKLQAIFCYSDTQGVATANVSKSRNVIVASANGGEHVGVESLKSGGLAFSYEVPWAAIGKQMVNAAYNKVTNQGGNLAPTIVVEGGVLNQTNLGDKPGV